MQKSHLHAIKWAIAQGHVLYVWGDGEELTLNQSRGCHQPWGGNAQRLVGAKMVVRVGLVAIQRRTTHRL